MAVRMNMQGKHVLSMGTDDPWLEALILEAGAEKITSLGNTMPFDYRQPSLFADLVFAVSTIHGPENGGKPQKVSEIS